MKKSLNASYYSVETYFSKVNSLNPTEIKDLLENAFFRVIPRRMEDPTDTMKLASASGYKGKFSCQLISFFNSRLNLSCLNFGPRHADEP